MSDSEIDRTSEGFAELVADVLSADAVALDLLLRHAREPETLSEAERKQVEAYLAASPAHRDRQAVMLRMAEAAVSQGGVQALAEADARSEPETGVGAQVIPLSRARRPATWMALAASVALVVLGVWAMGRSGGVAPERIASEEPPHTPAVPAPVPELAPIPGAPEPVVPQTIAEGTGGEKVPEPIPAPLAPPPEAQIAEAPAPVAPASEPPPEVQIAEAPAPVVPTGEPAPRAAPTPAPDTPEPTQPPDDAPIVIAALLDAGPLLYHAPSGRDAIVRVDGAARAADTTLVLNALAPTHTGITLEASPTLYWFVSEEADAAQAFSLIPADGIEPLLELEVAATTRAGIHRIDLAEHDVILEPGVDYQWSVAVVPDSRRRGRDIVAAAEIRRVVDADLTARVAAAPAAERGHALADAGVWYDALDFLSRQIARHPEEVALRQRRGALLAEVGLEEAARWEREASPGDQRSWN